MGTGSADIHQNTRLMVYTAAAMCAAAFVDAVVDVLLPGDPTASNIPIYAVGLMVVALLTAGPMLGRRTIACFGPIGVALIAYSLGTTPGPNDAAILYALPVIWTSFFFGWRGTLAIIAWVAVCQAGALMALPHASSYAGRWVDVMVGVAAVGLSVRMLDERLRASSEEAREEARHASVARDVAVAASNAKSLFVAKVSHELRTPLNGVLGTTELLLDTKLDERQQEYVDIARSAAESLLLVINDILDFSKIEAGGVALEMRDFSLTDTIGEVCAMLVVSANAKGVEVAIEIDPSVPPLLRGDAGRVRQVLVNLVSNAVKFTHKGTVTVRARATPHDKRARLMVEVIDTGIGIEPEALMRLFEPFTQADNSTARRYGGTGLGLTISAQLVESMGGQIDADSEPGKGTRFWFELDLAVASGEPTLSLAGDSEKPQAAPPLRIDHGDGPAPLILVAEDNPINQILATRMLESLGYRIELVGDGREALEAVSRNDYAAVMMDCQMPELDGYEATREIRQREGTTRHVPIIAMTAHSMAGDREKCLAAGMDDYITKPIRSSALAETLARNLAGAAAADGAQQSGPLREAS
jgi:signal transduction histidine kinase/CheY-like chemotaxis protein